MLQSRLWSPNRPAPASHKKSRHCTRPRFVVSTGPCGWPMVARARFFEDAIPFFHVITTQCWKCFQERGLGSSWGELAQIWARFVPRIHDVKASLFLCPTSKAWCDGRCSQPTRQDRSSWCQDGGEGTRPSLSLSSLLGGWCDPYEEGWRLLRTNIAIQ